jgi:hypothetical protein
VALDVDVSREQDIEELRRIAQALETQNQQLVEPERQSRELDRLRGRPGDLHQLNARAAAGESEGC